MNRALELARQSLGSTAPNPAVGAVLLRDGEVIGEGRTQPIGGAHAEVHALDNCRNRGNDPRGATMYVTLEPCCHHGRTPPCTDALVAAGVARVVVGTLDPFEPMRGASLAKLEAAGIATELGLERTACDRQILGFARAITRGLPEVTIKAAMSADGRIATASGESQWITGAAAREVGQRLRGSHDAILVGIGTVLADDPKLTCRLEGMGSPVPVVLDSRGRFPSGCALDRAECLLYTLAPISRAAEVVVAPPSAGRVDLKHVLADLAQRGHHRVLIEGGAEIIRSALDAGLVDTVELFVAGKLIPGGKGWVGGPALGSLGAAHALHLEKLCRVGEDAWLTWHADHRQPPEVI